MLPDAITHGGGGESGPGQDDFTVSSIIPEQYFVEMERILFLMSISDGSSLAVLAHPDADIGLVGYEMALLVDRAGRFLPRISAPNFREAFLTSRQTVRFFCHRAIRCGGAAPLRSATGSRRKRGSTHRRTPIRG
ncbi:hypothetical protein SMICM304S_03585 [Streptomyces microflavus]